MKHNIRVVVADDNADVLMATADLIADYPGVEVVSLACNVEEAIAAAGRLRPHLVFVDAWLKGGCAEDATTGIAALSRETVVVGLASAKDHELVLRLRAAGAAGCYDKESLSAELPGILAAVRRA